MLRRLRSSAAVALTSGLVLIMSAVGAIPAAAAHGDMWAQPGGTAEETSGHSQEVHLPCGNVDIWGDKLENTSGTWVLYHKPPPNTGETEVARGTYSYSGDDATKIATIPLSVLHTATGPHFKLELENDNSKWKTFWLDCKVSIATTQNPATATVGATLNDTAALSGGFSPTGTITFKLYNPSGDVAHTESVNVSGNGPYSTATGHVADQVGTWYWQAVYSGNDGNDSATSDRTAEPVVVNQAQPSIGTTPNPTSALVGATLKDTATLSGGYHPTGTITFTLFNPSDESAYTETVTVSGNGSYSTADGFTANTAGTWQWSAAYSGDANNKAVHSLKADEPVVVTEEQHQAQPTISTEPNQTSTTVGATLKDSATLSNGNHPTGTITFTLFNPSDESVYTEEVAVDGNGSYSTVTGRIADRVGTWHWSAEYSGDEGNKAVHSLKADEPVVVNQAQPSISTTPDPTSAIAGATLNDTATLSGGYHPTGTITFTLYDPSDDAVFTKTVTVSANGSYSTVHGFTASTTGTWHWSAAFSGDANNKAVHSLKADEPVIVTQEHHQAQPSISTAPHPTSAIVGATLNDTATLSGGNEPAGTITFTLYDPNDESAYTESVAVHGNGPYSTATGHIADMVGTWHWSAAYSGDEGNLAVHSLKADEPVVVSAEHQRAQPTITTTPNPTTANSGVILKDSATLSGGDSPTGTIKFTLYNPSNVSMYVESVEVDGNGQYSTAHGFHAGVAGTWHWTAEYSGDENNLPVASNAADEPVKVNASGEVLAATGSTSLAGALALVLLGFGGLAIMTAAVVLRRRPS